MAPIPVRHLSLVAFVTLVSIATMSLGHRLAGAAPSAAPGAGASPAPTAQEVVRLAANEVAFETPPFIERGKRYAFTWPGGGPPQTYTIKVIRPDGWVQVDVAEDNTDPAFYVAGQVPTMWLHVGIAISIQEMRPLPGYGN